jgi:hypothetical protein
MSIDNIERQIAELEQAREEQLAVLEAAKIEAERERERVEISKVLVNKYLKDCVAEMMEWGDFSNKRLMKGYWERFEGDKEREYIYKTFIMLRSAFYGASGSR